MKKITLLIVLFISGISFSQTTHSWSPGGNGNWSTPANWSPNGALPGSEIIRFNNNLQLTSINNASSTNRYQIFFDTGATSARLINGTTENTFSSFGGNNPKIENNSTGTHTINFPIRLLTNPMEINPVNGNLSFNGAINLQSNILEILGNNAKTVEFNGIISGGGGVTVKENSTVIYTAANTYSGGTIITSGALQLGNSGTTGSVVGNIRNNSALIFNRTGSQTFDGVISGSGSVTKNGNSTLILTRTNTHTGGTTITAGTLQLGDGGPTGSVSGNITNNSALIVNLIGTQSFGGVVSGTGSVTKIGDNTIILGGTNTYSGGTTVSAGTLQIGNGGSSLGSITGNVINNAAIVFNRSGNITSNVIISGPGTWTKLGSSTFTFSQDQLFTGDAILNSGALLLNKNIANSTMTVNNGATLRITGADVKLNGLIVNSGGIVIIEPGSALSLSNNLVVNGTGSVTLESTSTTYSSIVVSGTTTGNINYKRNVNVNSSTGGNDLISSPVSGQTFGPFASNNTNIVTDPNNANRKLFGPFDKTTGTFLLYNTVNNASTPLVAGEGYRAASTGGTFNFTGTPNTGQVDRSIADSGPQFARWNLVGNPYPSYLYVKEETTGPNAHPGFLNLNLTQLNSAYAYIYGYDNDGSDGNIYTLWNLANTLPTTAVTPGQGFFLAASPTGGTVSFTPGMRAIGNTDDFILGRSSEAPFTFLKLMLNNGTTNYATEFYFNDASTLGLDPGYDAGIFGNNAPAFSLYSHLVENSSGIDIQLQSLPLTSLGSEVIIPIGLKAGQGQQLTVSISELSIPTGVEVYFEDTVMGISTLLNSSNYVFNTTSNLAGVGRFYLRFTNSTLSNTENILDDIRIISTQSPKTLIVKGQLQDNSVLDLYDIQGRLVISSVLNSSILENQVDVSNVKTGIYLVKLNTERSQITKKIIIR